MHPVPPRAEGHFVAAEILSWPVAGSCNPRFAPMREASAANFGDNGDRGLARIYAATLAGLPLARQATAAAAAAFAHL